MHERGRSSPWTPRGGRKSPVPLCQDAPRKQYRVPSLHSRVLEVQPQFQAGGGVFSHLPKAATVLPSSLPGSSQASHSCLSSSSPWCWDTARLRSQSCPSWPSSSASRNRSRSMSGAAAGRREPPSPDRQGGPRGGGSSSTRSVCLTRRPELLQWRAPAQSHSSQQLASSSVELKHWPMPQGWAEPKGCRDCSSRGQTATAYSSLCV